MTTSKVYVVIATNLNDGLSHLVGAYHTLDKAQEYTRQLKLSALPEVNYYTDEVLVREFVNAPQTIK